MKIIGEKLSSKELLMVKGGCDIKCYCDSLETIIYGDNPQSAIDAAGDAWDDHNCPTGIADPQ